MGKKLLIFEVFMAISGLSNTELQTIGEIFVSEEFKQGLTDGKEKDSYAYTAAKKDSDLARLFVLTHSAADTILASKGLDDKETLLLKLRAKEEEKLKSIEAMKALFGRIELNATNYVNGTSKDPTGVMIAEVPAHRIMYHEFTIFTKLLSGFTSVEELHEAVRNNLSSDAELNKLMVGMDVSKLSSGTFKLSDTVSFGEKVWMSFCNTMLLVEAVWRTFAESVMYIVHWMMKDQFEADGYSLDERKDNLQMQWQSTILVAGAIWNPVGVLEAAKNLETQVGSAEYRLKDNIGDVGRGTPYAGKFQWSTSGLTTDVWKKV